FVLELREREDGWNNCTRLIKRGSHSRTSEQDVLHHGGVCVETEGQVHQCMPGAFDVNPAACWLISACQYVQQRGLARTVPADDGKPVSVIDLERHRVDQCHELALRCRERGSSEHAPPAPHTTFAMKIH